MSNDNRENLINYIKTAEDIFVNLTVAILLDKAQEIDERMTFSPNSFFSESLLKSYSGGLRNMLEITPKI